jgi:hypothetical protein
MGREDDLRPKLKAQSAREVQCPKTRLGRRAEQRVIVTGADFMDLLV